LNDFAKQVKDFNDAHDLKTVNKIRNEAAKSVSLKIIKDTPKVTGYTRDNWQTALNKKAEGEVNLGSNSRGKNENVSDKAKPKDDIYFTNNVPWIQKLEMGSSKQAPRGMVRLNTRQWNKAVADAATKLGW
jgi:hypothetical protein